MKTLEQIKKDILNSNPLRIKLINDEQIELSEEEFQQAIHQRATMEFEQQEKAISDEQAKQEAEAKLAALGLSLSDLKALGL